MTDTARASWGHTFAYGGVGLTINTLNKQFDLDIQDYIIVNFENLVGIIDELGGIQVKLTEEEAEYYRQTGMPDIRRERSRLPDRRHLPMRETEAWTTISDVPGAREMYSTVSTIR